MAINKTLTRIQKQAALRALYKRTGAPIQRAYVVLPDGTIEGLTKQTKSN